MSDASAGGPSSIVFEAPPRDESLAVFDFVSVRNDVGRRSADAVARALIRAGAYREVERIERRLGPEATERGEALPCDGHDVALLGRVTKHSAFTEGLPFAPTFGHAVLAADLLWARCADGRVEVDAPGLKGRFERAWTGPAALKEGAIRLAADRAVERLEDAWSARPEAGGPGIVAGGAAISEEGDAPRASGVVGGRYSPFYAKRIAVVIGIDEYRRWPRLEGARGDAKRVASLLREQGFDRVIELYDAEATRGAMLRLLGERLPSLTGSDDLVVIFFAGHGQTETLPNEQKRGYIIPVDADVDGVFATAISMAQLRDLSNRMSAKHVFYAMDSCYSGLGLTRGLSVSRDVPDFLETITTRRAVQMITAGSEGDQAIEVGGQGLFTTKLIEGLRGAADVNGDGAVTTTELGSYVVPEVAASSRNRQIPRFGTLQGSGEIVFLPQR